MKNAICAGCTIAGIFLLSLTMPGAPTESHQTEGVDFQVVPDKTVYSPGASMHVKFVVENTAESPVYLFRYLSQCSSQIGSYSLIIHDGDNRVVNRDLCSSDLLWDKVDVVQELNDPKSGVQLRQYEIFGKEGDFKFPDKKGTYKLEGVLVPAGFTDEHKAALSKNRMKVLRYPCAAPIVTIRIR
jgi:hypothetical protein